MQSGKSNNSEHPEFAEPQRKRVLALAFLLALVTAIAYSPVRNHEFVGYDDPRYVTRNEVVKRGFGPGSVEYAFQSDDGGNWHPLTWFSHMLDVELFGVESAGHHVSNAIYHVLATVLLFLFLHASTGTLWRSAFVAGAFALHPLHVESVAWVAERKDTLSAVMWMATLLAYWWYSRKPDIARYLLLFLIFALGLMSKPMLVTLPLVLLLLDIWPLDRMQLERSRAAMIANLRLIAEKLPLLALSAVASYITVITQRSKGAVVAMHVNDLGDRISNALLSYLGYLGKTLWPVDLAVFYPYPSSFDAIEVAAAFMVLLGISAYSLLRLRRQPYFAVGWFWFVGTLVPVIGFVQVGAQAMADRYTYLPLVGIFIIVAWGFVDLLGTRLRATWLIACGAVVLGLWLVGTRLQLRHWENEELLYSHAIAVTTDNFMMHHNLGKVLQDKGRTEEAIEHYREAVRINGWGPSRRNLGVLLSARGQQSEAIEVYRRALRASPNDSMLHNNLANSLAASGEMEEALTHFRRAVQLRPNNYQAQSNYALNLAKAGYTDEAIEAARAALRVNPRFAQAHNALGIALALKGRPVEAIAAYREAMRLIRNWPPAMRRLAWLYATYPEDSVRSGKEAVQLAREASRRTGDKDARMLDTLAAAYAESGRFDAALATAGKALAAARSAQDDLLAAEIEARITLYESGLPYRENIGVN